MTIESTLERIAVALETIAGKAPEAAQLVAPAEPAKRGRKSAQAAAAPAATTAAEADLFGSASEATAPAKNPTASTTSTATSTASPSEEDDLFGEKPAAKEEPKPKATIEQLRKALVDCQTKHGHKDHALGVLKKFTRDGNPTISSLDEAKYQDVIDACAKYVPTK